MGFQTTREDIDDRINYHRPTEEGIGLIAANRKAAKQFALTVLSGCPEGRDKSLALTKIEEALFWANASIARAPQYQAETEQP